MASPPPGGRPQGAPRWRPWAPIIATVINAALQKTNENLGFLVTITTPGDDQPAIEFSLAVADVDAEEIARQAFELGGEGPWRLEAVATTAPTAAPGEVLASAELPQLRPEGTTTAAAVEPSSRSDLGFFLATFATMALTGAGLAVGGKIIEALWRKKWP